jgi:hypothetical protein
LSNQPCPVIHELLQWCRISDAFGRGLVNFGLVFLQQSVLQKSVRVWRGVLLATPGHHPNPVCSVQKAKPKQWLKEIKNLTQQPESNYSFQLSSSSLLLPANFAVFLL